MPLNIVRQYKIVCDECGKFAYIEILLKREDQIAYLHAEKEIERMGWSFSTEKALCPECLANQSERE